MKVAILILALSAICLAQSPGEVVGTTYIEYQSNGSVGNKIAIGDDDRIHIVWTRGMAEGGIPRYVYYNYRDSNGVWIGETPLSPTNGTGFVTLDLSFDNGPVAAYNYPGDDASIAISNIDGEFPIEGSTPFGLPQIAWNNDGRLHMVCEDLSAGSMGYSYSTDNGESWSILQDIGAHELASATICTSPVTSSTAIVFTALNQAGYYDVIFYESEDGQSWPWRDPINITEFGPDDGYSAWADLDCIYDYYDELHISYQRQEARGDTIFVWGDLMHWSEYTGHTVIATHPSSDTCSPVSYCTCISKMSLGVDSINNVMYALWTEGSQQDISAGGYSNGELYAAVSGDHGSYWLSKVNITNTYTPGCVPPNCGSEIWSSMAEIVDAYLHIMYIDDNDAGAAWNGEGQWTQNDVLYLEYPVRGLIPVEVNDHNSDLPTQLYLQSYPNPFNAQTSIGFSLAEQSHIKLQIFDIAGRLVETLAEGEYPAGENSVIWSAGDHSSGVYFAKLATSSGEAAKRLILLK